VNVALVALYCAIFNPYSNQPFLSRIPISAVYTGQKMELHLLLKILSSSRLRSYLLISSTTILVAS